MCPIHTILHDTLSYHIITEEDRIGVGVQEVVTVRLTSIDHPQIEGKFTAQANQLIGCKD